MRKGKELFCPKCSSELSEISFEGEGTSRQICFSCKNCGLKECVKILPSHAKGIIDYYHEMLDKFRRGG